MNMIAQNTDKDSVEEIKELSLTIKQRELIMLCMEKTNIESNEMVFKNPYKVLFYLQNNIESLKRQMMQAIELRLGSEITDSYKEKIEELNCVIEKINHEILNKKNIIDAA